jgi:hypothetical protein
MKETKKKRFREKLKTLKSLARLERRRRIKELTGSKAVKSVG